ncbi:MAG: helix-turn-helix domain-containing protein [Gemmatimonadetes bacterium]|nr:helix-turn-helix domain-containing protein [Gemmatimonadota bacterium]
MDTPTQRLRKGAILPAPACDLLDRLTAELDIRFTLTDLHGAVVASTGSRPAGRVDPRVLAVLESGQPRELEDDPLDPDAAGVYLPVRLAGRIAGALITHGRPGAVGAAARSAAVAIGLALDFAEAASSLGYENVNPGWLLYRLLRGSRVEAQQARVVASIYGWNLCVQRIAIVIMAAEGDRQRVGADPGELLEGLLGPGARTTPFGQIDEAQWVLLPEFEPRASRERIRDLAEVIRLRLAAAGQAVDVGIGEPHLPVNPILSVRRSYREAIYAARLGPRLRGEPGVYELRALGSAAFFAPSSPSRRNLAALVLVPLREHPMVLGTLRTYLACNMSVAGTAEHLNVHRHTVRNHLGRVFSLTGLDPRSLEGAVQLKLALLVAASDPDAQDA